MYTYVNTYIYIIYIYIYISSIYIYVPDRIYRYSPVMHALETTNWAPHTQVNNPNIGEFESSWRRNRPAATPRIAQVEEWIWPPRKHCISTGDVPCKGLPTLHTYGATRPGTSALWASECNPPHIIWGCPYWRWILVAESMPLRNESNWLGGSTSQNRLYIVQTTLKIDDSKITKQDNIGPGPIWNWI